MALPHGPLDVVRRRELSSAHAEAIFAAAAGELAGPLEGDTGESGGGQFDLMRVIRIEIADLENATTRDAVRGAVFEQWLADQRRSATIEWFWGPAH